MALGPLSRLTVPQGRLAARRDTREADHAPPLLTKQLLPVLITSSLPTHPHQTHLIAGRAARLGRLRMVSTAVELAVLVEVDQVDEQLLADGAGKAGGVPDPLGARARSCHADVSAEDRVSALQDKLLEVKKWCDGICDFSRLTDSQDAGLARVTGICLTVPRPRASLFL